MDHVEKKSYRVKPGFTYGPGGIYGPGEVVELTEYEAYTVLDKLELVTSPPAPLPTTGEGGAELNISKGALKWLAENEIELDFSAIEGTGRDGQITLTDVKAASDSILE